MIGEVLFVELRLERPNRLVGAAHAGTAHRRHLDDRTELIEIEDRLRIQLSAEETPARTEVDEPLGDEPVEGLAERRPADIEIPGQGDLVHPFARSNLEIDDSFLEPCIDAFDTSFARPPGDVLHQHDFLTFRPTAPLDSALDTR